MTHAELASALAAIKHALGERVEIWTQIVEADGTFAERIYQGSFQQPRDSIRESHSQER